MSQLQNVIAAIGATQRRVREETSRINSFQSANEENIRRVVETLQGGSARGYDARLLAQLEKTQEQLRKTLDALAQADLALTRVAVK